MQSVSLKVACIKGIGEMRMRSLPLLLILMTYSTCANFFYFSQGFFCHVQTGIGLEFVTHLATHGFLHEKKVHLNCSFCRRSSWSLWCSCWLDSYSLFRYRNMILCLCCSVETPVYRFFFQNQLVFLKLRTETRLRAGQARGI